VNVLSRLGSVFSGMNVLVMNVIGKMIMNEVLLMILGFGASSLM